MNLLFFGSHQYSLYALEALDKAGYQILAVVTQPDRPVGRKQILTPTPVKTWAVSHQIPVLTPKNKEELVKFLLFERRLPQATKSRTTVLSNNFSTRSARSKNKIDFCVVSVYGMIIPEKVLNIPKYGFINLHPSLLPKYRGAAPVPAAIINNEKETGVSIMMMDKKLDHGPILAQEKEIIKDTDTAETLYHRLFKKGTELLIKTLPSFISCHPESRQRRGEGSSPQDHSLASFTRMLKRNDGFIPWEHVKSAMEGKDINNQVVINFIKDNQGKSYIIHNTLYFIHNFIRGLSPWPGAWTEITFNSKHLTFNNKKKRLKLLKSHIDKEKLVLDEVQLEGEKPTPFVKTYLAGRQVKGIG